MGGEPEREAGREADENAFELMVVLGEPFSFVALVDAHDVLREPDGLIGVIPNARRTEWARWWPLDGIAPLLLTPRGGEAGRELDGLCVMGAVSNVGRAGYPPPCNGYVKLPGLLPLLLLGPLESCGVGRE